MRSNVTPTELDKSRELILEQALRKSRRIYEEAVKRAEDTVESATLESRSIRIEAEQRGYQDGYVQGLKDGSSRARSDMEEGLREIGELILAISNERREALERQEKDLLKIAFEIAKKIMRQQIQADENSIAQMLEEVISEHETGVKIYLPEYSKTLDVVIDKSVAKKIRNASKNVKVVITQNDDLIMAETECGTIDMSIPVQLKQLQKAIGLD
ncbi:MAG: hypothetical protein GXX92_03400 [Clostridiales bacterium]|nr:hypothetical protein [Clostridiales bacterium]